MRVAFAAWEDRVAPVFDVARTVRVVEAEAGKIVSEAFATLADDRPAPKAQQLADLGVEALVCGAISRPLHSLIAGYGIHVTPFVSGGLREVIEAWVAGRLNADAFAMPGCCGRGRRWFARAQRFGQEEFVMNSRSNAGMDGEMAGPGASGGEGGMGRGRGRGRGQRQGGRGRGRMGGGMYAGPGGFCVCPQCGRREPHQRGVPCAQRECPSCGARMTRE